MEEPISENAFLNPEGHHRMVPKPGVSFDPPVQPGPIDTQIATGRSLKTYHSKIRIELPITEKTFLAQPEVRGVLKEMMKVEPSMKIYALDNSLAVDNPDAIPSTEEGFKQFFMYAKQKPPNTGMKHVIYAMIETHRELSAVKNEILEYIRTRKIFVRRHEWNCTEIYAIGFFAMIHPRLNWRQDLEITTRKIIQSLAGPDQVIPEFKLVRLTKSIGNENRIKADVIEVHCDKKDAADLKKVFASPQFAELTEGRFIPEGTIVIAGESVYRNILIQHNKFMNNTKTIPLQNLKVEALTGILNTNSDDLYSIIINGASGQYREMKIKLHRTNSTNTDGRWLVACAKEHINSVRGHLDHVFSVIFPKMIKESGCNDPERIYLNGNPPGIQGRYTADPAITACYSNLANDFGKALPEDTVLEHQIKKRRTYDMSYAAVTMPNTISREPTIAPVANISNENMLQKMMTKHLEQQNIQQREMFAEFSQKTDKKLEELSRKQEEKLTAFTIDQASKLDSFAKTTFNFLQDQQSSFNTGMQDKFEDMTKQQDERFTAFQEAMKKNKTAVGNTKRVSLDGGNQ